MILIDTTLGSKDDDEGVLPKSFRTAASLSDAI